MMKPVPAYHLSVCLLIFLLGFILAVPQKALSQSPEDYDELFVYLSIENVGYVELDALYHEEELYLPIIGMFQNLKLFVEYSPRLDTVKGYFGNPDNQYLLLAHEGKLSFEDKLVELEEDDLITTYGDVFLPMSVYEKVFRFDLRFDFRSLTVFLQSSLELPIVKMLRIERMRENLKVIRGEVNVDTTFPRDPDLIDGLVIDWNINTAQQEGKKPGYQLRTAIGAEMLGGELILNTAFNNGSKFRIKDQSGYWRLVRNDSRIVKQVNVGMIQPPSFSQIIDPMAGLKVSNTPTTFRKSFGTYVLQRATEPGWEVELYVNNVFLGLEKADANGEYRFEIPLIYGNSVVTLKQYGPWGEEVIDEEVINVPFLFVPKKTLEYQLYTGMTLDSSARKLGFFKASYGLGRKSTVSVGYETFEGNSASRHLPFATLSLAPLSRVLLNYTYVMNAIHMGAFSYRTNKNFSIEGDIRAYDPDQDAILTSNKYEGSIGVNSPFSIRKVNGNFKGSLRQSETKSGVLQSLDANLSVYLGRINFGALAAMSLSEPGRATLGLNASVFFPRQWSLYTMSQSNVSAMAMKNVRVQLQKRLSRNYFASCSWDYAIAGRSSSVMVNFYLDLQGLRSAFGGGQQNGSWRSEQSFSGTMLLSNSVAPLSFYSRPSVGRGAVDVIGYLDLDHDDQRDKGEPLIKTLEVSMSKGVEVLFNNDSVHRSISLEPYTQHVIKIDNGGFPSISWILPFRDIAVYPDPNQIKKILIPVKPMGEVEGRILYLTENGQEQPASRIVAIIYDEDGSIVKKLMSGFDGYFNYLGLKPGNYTVALDEAQLSKLGVDYDGSPLSFEIKQSRDGDFVFGLEIVLKK